MTAFVTRRLRQAASDDSGVAMLMALFIIAMLATISLGVAGITVSQALPTRIDNKAAKVVQTAQAGIDSALAQIRAANDGSGNGVNTLLPCKITGNVNSTSTLTYNVTVYYFNSTNDPTSHLSDDTWLNANDLATTCLTTSPYIGIPASAGNAALVPWFAAVVSNGTGPRAGSNAQYGDRSLRTIYNFVISNVNVAGGPLLVFPTASNLCLDGANYVTDPTGKTVKAGDVLVVKTCSATKPGQLFSYTPDLTLQVVATSPAGTLLCVNDGGSAGAAAAANQLTLKVCDTGLPTNAQPNSNDWRQQWSFDGAEQFVGSLADTSDKSGVCLVSSASTPVDGSAVAVANCPGTSYNPATSWYPNSKVGAGAAGSALNQLVNYQYFGNCLDVTNEDVSWSFIIGYVCKQNPKPANVVSSDWNQVWVFNSATKEYVTTHGSTPYCLQTASSTPALHDVVTVGSCSGGPSQQWQYTGGTAGDGHYSTDYEIQPVASPSLCLTLTMPAPSSFMSAHSDESTNLQQWGYNSVENCTGADNQKWNAPAGVSSATLTGTYEHPNT
jgi:Ricin-type beta-trefoil lectin domain